MGLASLLELPVAVQETYGEVLQPNLAPTIDDRTETFVKRYARRYEIEPEQLAPSIRACRFLFSQAVKVGLDREGFVADVRALLPGGDGDDGERVIERLLPIFDELLPKMRHAAVFLSVAEHGRVVKGVRWRMDVITASDHGVRLDMPVATITLQYQEGPNAGQASYQILPDQAGELLRALTAILD